MDMDNETINAGLNESPETNATTETEPKTIAALTHELATLQARLAEAEKKAAENLDGWQRAQASFANFRKRADAERETWRESANATLLMRFLPVLDDFERAFQDVPESMREQAWVEGIALIRRKFMQVLEIEGVKALEVQPGDAFDPLYHQAIYHQENAEVAEGHVLLETQRGYLHKERVLRPTMVVVAKAPVIADSAGTDAPDSTEATAA